MSTAHLVPLSSELAERAGTLPRVQLQGVVVGWVSCTAKAVSRE